MQTPPATLDLQLKSLTARIERVLRKQNALLEETQSLEQPKKRQVNGDNEIMQEQHELLTKERERLLIQLFQENRDLYEQQKGPFALRYKDRMQGALDELVAKNMRLVMSVVKKYWKPGVNFLDLRQNGVIGLITAINRFDIELGTRLGTYATWYIRQAAQITVAYDTDGQFKISPHNVAQIAQISQLNTEYLDERGRFPTLEEIRKATGMGEKVIKGLMHAKMTSINDSLSDDVADEVGTLLPAPGGIGDPGTDSYISSTFAEVLNNDKGTSLDEYLQKLGKRRETIVRLRYFGCAESNWEPMSLQEVADRLGISKERVRQIQKKAVKKLQVLMGSKAGSLLSIPDDEDDETSADHTNDVDAA